MALFSSLFIAAFFLLYSFMFSVAVDSFSQFQSISDGRTLVSREENFELGFFSPGNSKNRYLGIWYKKFPVKTVVWVANRCKPINDSSGLLIINSTGNLVVLYRNKSVVWSTSSLKQPQKPIVELLDSGNLVVRDEKDRNPETYLWQSFDYPSDTFLPGMKLGRDLRTGLNRRVWAWKNTEDPCVGDLNYGLESYAYPEVYIRKGITKYFRSGPWNGLYFGGALQLRPNPFYVVRVVDNDEEVYVMYYLTNKSVMSRIYLNPTTSTRERFIWIEPEQSWRLVSSAPTDYCDSYGLCGANGICIASENPVCQCLKGFKPKSQEKWSSMDWSDGCVRISSLSCLQGKGQDGFIKFKQLKMPDTTTTRVNNSMNLKECRAKCLSNCSCMAYSNSDISGGGRGCVMWFGDLLDIRQIPGGQQDLYIRMPASELPKGDRKVKALIIAIVIGVVIGMLSVGYCFFRKILKGKTKKNRTISLKSGRSEEEFELPLFDLSTLTSATDSFSLNNKLGEGGFGPVYKGKLENGQEIAVKRLSMSSGQGENEFKNEVLLIAKLQHRNLVKLLGCCIHREEKLLVYEYMPNKSLDSFIFDQPQDKLLEWPKRFQIICGIARGLLYLHQDSRLRIIHRDLKASNVLLDNEMNPKISDFGMARSFGEDQIEGKTNRVVGTYGYMAPEYAFNGLFSIKSDIFSFGILVLEIVSGKRSRVFRPQTDSLTLTGHAWKLLKENRAIELLDVCLRDLCNSSEVLRCIHVGLLCVQQCPIDRPSMSSIVKMLDSENALPQPKMPGYFMETDIPPHQLSLTNNMTISVLEAR